MPPGSDEGLLGMARRLPPLNAVRSFEAAARHRSMTKAAQELGVSQVAITRAVQLLESRVGLTLFSRNNRRLSLTPSGEEYFRVVNQVLEDLSAATSRITRSHEQHLRIWSYNVFNWWLLPRMREFISRHPDIKVELTTSSRLEGLDSNDFDAVVHERSNDIPTSETIIPLFETEFTPLCRPGPEAEQLKRFDDLNKWTLLHSAYRPEAWSEWLSFVGCDSVEPNTGIYLDNSSSCFHAATEGVGVALGQLRLLREELDRGRLIQPFKEVLRTNQSYFLFINRTRRKPGLKAFVDCILAAL